MRVFVLISVTNSMYRILEDREWEDDNWNVPRVYFAEDAAIVYDLKGAIKPVYKGGGWEVKRQREAAAAEAEDK